MLLVLGLLMFGMVATSGCDKDEPATGPTGSDTPAAETPDSPPPVDAEAALEDACAQCHDLSRVYLQSDATDWADVISRMDAEHAKSHPGDAALLTVEQRDAIIAFMKTRTQSVGEVVVREKCVTCHELTNLTKQTQGADWTAIMDRMVTQHGAQLTEQEQQDALNFLMGQ